MPSSAPPFTAGEIATEERRVDHDCFVNCCHDAWRPGHEDVRRWLATIRERDARIAELEALCGPACPVDGHRAIEHANTDFDPPCAAKYPEGGGYNLVCMGGRNSNFHDQRTTPKDGTEHDYLPLFEPHPPVQSIQRWLDANLGRFRELAGDKYRTIATSWHKWMRGGA